MSYAPLQNHFRFFVKNEQYNLEVFQWFFSILTLQHICIEELGLTALKLGMGRLPLQSLQTSNVWPPWQPEVLCNLLRFLLCQPSIPRHRNVIVYSNKSGPFWSVLTSTLPNNCLAQFGLYAPETFPKSLQLQNKAQPQAIICQLISVPSYVQKLSQCPDSLARTWHFSVFTISPILSQETRSLVKIKPRYHQPSLHHRYTDSTCSTWCPSGPPDSFQLDGPQHVHVPRLVPLQVQNSELPFVQYEVSFSLPLQPLQVSLAGSTGLWHISHSSQFWVICKLAEGTLCPISQIINEDIKLDWIQ